MQGARAFSALVTIVLLTAGICPARYSGGTGEPNSPYRIGDANDMQQIGANPDDWDKHFVQVNDINLAEFTETEFNIIGAIGNSFRGVFDGNDHTISNFTYECNNTYRIGLFGVVGGEDAEIKNLKLKDPNIEAGGAASVGALVGQLDSGTVGGCEVDGGKVSADRIVAGLVGGNLHGRISNCHVMTCVSGNSQTGGLVGSVLMKMSNILNCSSGGSVFGAWDTGGLVGTNIGMISNCCTSGVVEGTSNYTGGLVGSHLYGIISNSYFAGHVWGANSTGGLVGVNASSCCDYTIVNCYSTGTVKGNDYTGGLVGENCSGIANCYAAGPVDGNNYAGGLVGYDSGEYYTKCFWDSDVNPDVNGIGNMDDPNVIGKTTAEMRTESTFTDAGWDFVEVWNIGENQTYPFLRVHPAGDINHDDRVNFLDLAILVDHWLEDGL